VFFVFFAVKKILGLVRSIKHCHTRRFLDAPDGGWYGPTVIDSQTQRYAAGE